jgi:6-phospho-beta-glucosidase
MKLVIVGGSAHSTPNLFACDPLRELAETLEVVLLGRSTERLDAVARAIELITAPTTFRVASVAIAPGGDMSALRGADVVLCQARYGGYEARESDETFPLKFGLCGDEGLGVGGLAAAWRAWPVLRETLISIRRHAPLARIILMTSPVGILTRCALDEFGDLWLAGVCELPWTTLTDACVAVGADVRGATFAYAGVNHLGWFWSVFASGRDVVAEYAAARQNAIEFPSGALIERLGAIPLKYLRLHYEADSVLEEQRKSPRSRGRELLELQERAYAAYRTRDRPAIVAHLRARSTPWYEHAIAPLIGGFGGRASPTASFLTVRNGSYTSAFDAQDVLEIPHRFSNGDLKPLDAIGAIPDRLRAPLDAFVEFERAASNAVRNRDTKALAAAIKGHPWVRDGSVATQLAAEIGR